MTSEEKHVVVPDSEEARHLAVLASYSADLSEAATALEIGTTLLEANNDRDRAICRLANQQGVLAYWRCFAQSSVRPPITEFVTVPAHLAGLHLQAKHLRNRTIAHSESELQLTYVTVRLTRDVETTADKVFGVTIGNPAPQSFNEGLAVLVAALGDEMKPVIDAARAAVQVVMNAADLDDLWETGKPLQMTPGRISDWTPDSRRSAYPASALIPLHLFSG